MAYAALISLARTIDLILNYQQDSVSPPVKNQIISIDEYAIFLQVFLEHFPDEANGFDGRIRMVAHVAEDIIEFFMWEQIHDQSRYAARESTVGPSKSKFELQPKGQYEHWELKLVIKEFESIVEKVVEIKNSIRVKDVRLGDPSAASLSSRAAPVQKDVMVGLDDDLMVIKSRLCEESSRLEVIPIIGMGGIGKTTLARNAYDDPLIVERFEIRVWVTISQDYSAQEIVSDLLVSMGLLYGKNNPMNEQKVYQHLKGRRYLIVLDDTWSIKAWDDLKMMFPDDGNGSRIMLTTRISDVARYADSTSLTHEMRLMNEDQSWDLLRQKVFKQEPCPVELKYIGKIIARSCRGLPLAIVVIAGLLSAVDQTDTAWKIISEHVKSFLSANDEFDKIISLSYTHLPDHLRPCFLYMGILPANYKSMRVSKIIKLWVAEGFLKPNEYSKSFEETAEEYLVDLIKRNLILVTKRKSDGRIKSFSMHDVLREMCIKKAQEENFTLHVRGFLQESVKVPRCISVFHDDQHFLENIYCPTIRTIFCLKHREFEPCGFDYCRLLRILDLSDAHEVCCKHGPSYLPGEVLRLFHLRYLAFSSLSVILNGISYLKNLQTLIIGPKIHDSQFLIKLPVEIWRMPQLRHLVGFFSLSTFHEGEAFALDNLRTLSVARDLVCHSNILKMMPNLKKLGLSYAGGRDGKIYEYYQLPNLKHLQQLENLKLETQSKLFYWWKVNPAFPPTLKKLTLSGCGLPWEDMKIFGKLPNLEVLKLRDHAFIGDTWETREGEFSQLKFLLVTKSNLQNWITESSHFPRLRCLVLHYCSCLSEIPDGIGDIPTLELIDVNYNGESLQESAKLIQDYQQSCGNDDLQVMGYKEKMADGDQIRATFTLCHGGRFIKYNIGNIFEVTSKYNLLIRPIGKGANGIICSALNTETNEKVAIKKIANAFDNKIDAKRTLREIKLLRYMDHENIVAIRDVIPPPQREAFNDVYVAYELMDTDLDQIIRSDQALSEEHCQYFLYQILRGLKYIHSANVLHRNLKPSNLLLNANCDLKICDFGLARVTSKTDFMTEYVVTRWYRLATKWYRSPEILLNSSDYTAAIDVWSVGCIFMELMDRKPLFPGRDHVHQLRLLIELIGTPSESELGFLNEKAKRYIRQLPPYPRQSFAEKFPKVHPLAIDLVEKMLIFDPSQRITVEDALAHPYLNLLHDISDEPTCMAPFSFDFEQHALTEDQMRELIYQESLAFNPEYRLT